MCIILHHPEKAKLPQKQHLQNCFDKNYDGAGFMVIRNDKVRVRKGFMNFTDFWAAYTNERFTEADEFAVHFRWATAGGVSKANTHPFPLTADHSELRSLKYNTDIAVMHNGVVGFGLGTLSDTMLYVVDELSVLRDHLSDDSVLEYISDTTIGSRLIFFDLKSSGIFKTGEWVEDKLTGNFYSNKDWISSKKIYGYKKPKKSNYNTYAYGYGGRYHQDKDISLPMGQDFRTETQKQWDKERDLREATAIKADDYRGVVDALFNDELTCPNCTHPDITDKSNKDKLIHSFDVEGNIIITCYECGAVFDELGNVFDIQSIANTAEDKICDCPECEHGMIYTLGNTYVCSHPDCNVVCTPTEYDCPSCAGHDILLDLTCYDIDGEAYHCINCKSSFDFDQMEIFNRIDDEDGEEQYTLVDDDEDDYIICPECGKVILHDDEAGSYLCTNKGCTANYLYTSYICPYCHDKYGTNDHILFDLIEKEYICTDCCSCYTYKAVKEYRQNQDRVETATERREKQKKELLERPAKSVSMLYNCTCTGEPALLYTYLDDIVKDENILYVCPNKDCNSDYYYSQFLERVVIRRRPAIPAWKAINMISVLRCEYCNCYLNYTVQDRANEYFCPECDRKYYNSFFLQRNVLKIQ